MNETIREKVGWLVGAVIVTLVLGSFIWHSAPSDGKLGTTGAGITNLTGLSIAGTPGTFDVSSLTTLTGGWVSVGESATVTANDTYLNEQAVVGTCSTASSTVFSVANPFTSSSTLTFMQIKGTEGATTSDMLVATSSTGFVNVAAQIATSSIGANIMNIAAITNATQFYSVMGVTLGPAGGYKSSKSIPSSVSGSVVVGPGEFVIGFSTSTATASGGAGGATTTGLEAIPTSCTYKMNWRN